MPMFRDLSFGKALEYLKDGYKIKRSSWGGYWFIDEKLIGKNFVFGREVIVAKLKDGGYAPATPYQEDILAEDWEIVHV